jgi:putative Mg2+ transporter-C (MgtC) family protein
MRSLSAYLDADSVVRLDPSRIAAYAVAGMGFLGAGAIIRGRGSVQGLTTAACLWASNAIGLTVGAGLILHGVVVTGLVLLVLIVFQSLVPGIPKDKYYRLYMTFDGCEDRSFEIREILEDHTARVLYAGFDCRLDEMGSDYEVAIRVKSTQDLGELMTAVRRLEGLTRIRWSEGYVP